MSLLLTQGTKAIMKDVAKFVPGIGWMFHFLEYPIIKRTWDKDEARLKASCDSLADYPVNMLVSNYIYLTYCIVGLSFISLSVSVSLSLSLCLSLSLSLSLPPSLPPSLPLLLSSYVYLQRGPDSHQRSTKSV